MEKQILFKYTMDEIKAHAIYLGEFPSRKLADRFNATRTRVYLKNRKMMQEKYGITVMEVM